MGESWTYAPPVIPLCTKVGSRCSGRAINRCKNIGYVTGASWPVGRAKFRLVSETGPAPGAVATQPEPEALAGPGVEINRQDRTSARRLVA